MKEKWSYQKIAIQAINTDNEYFCKPMNVKSTSFEMKMIGTAE